MKRPWLWRAFGAWMTLSPLPMLNAVILKARSGELWEASSIFLFTAALVGLGMLFWRYTRSRVLISDWGIEAIGIRRLCISWAELSSIEGRYMRLRFQTTDGRLIEVDRARSNFTTLLRLLPNQVRPGLVDAAERAVRRVRLPEDELT